jgi:hypothetical protein
VRKDGRKAFEFHKLLAEQPYKKSSYDFCPKNIWLIFVHFQYIWLYDKCAKNCNKSHKNRIE